MKSCGMKPILLFYIFIINNIIIIIIIGSSSSSSSSSSKVSCINYINMAWYFHGPTENQKEQQNLFFVIVGIRPHYTSLVPIDKPVMNLTAANDTHNQEIY